MTRTAGAKRLRKFLSSVEGAQTALATKLGVTQSTVSRWSSGKSSPSDEHREALGRVLNIPPESWRTPKEARRAAFLAGEPIAEAS